MNPQKPRIIPWLIEQINSRSCPGLEWVNPEKTQFQVPWKHGLRRDRGPDDTKIFEAWAFASGSYNPITDERNPAVWKRNFRSALNRKNGIYVVKDNSADASNPHKVYQFGEVVTGSAGNVTPESYHSNSVSPSSDQPLFCGPGSQAAVNRNLSIEMLQLQISENDLYCAPEDVQSAGADEWYAMPSTDILGADAFPTHSPFMPYYEPGVPAQQMPQVAVQQTSQVAAQQTFHQQTQQTSQEPAQGASPEQVETIQQQLLNQFFPNNGFESQFEVKVYYRGTLVNSTLVKNPRGFHLTSRKPQNNPEAYLEDVYLPPPPPDKIFDPKAIGEINKLLQNLGQGTQVEVHNGVICGKRLGKCRSFWSMSDTPETFEPNPISKESFSELYKFQQFVKELIEFMEQRRKESPQYDIWICLGEFWPDRRPWKKKFIMVQVTPVSMQILHQMSCNAGASSLRSNEVNLQISDSLSLCSTSDLLTFLKEFEERMDHS